MEWKGNKPTKNNPVTPPPPAAFLALISSIFSYWHQLRRPGRVTARLTLLVIQNSSISFAHPMMVATDGVLKTLVPLSAPLA